MATKTMEWRPGPTVCRCCLAEGCYKDISTEYFWMGKREVYAEMLSETFSVSIAYSTAGGPNSNSRLICEPCISRLRDASEFKRQVQECEKTFMQHLDPGSSSALGCDGNMVNIEPEDVKVEAVKVESRLSDDEFDDRVDFGDDDDDDLDDEPLTKFATKVPKKESVDILDLLDNSKAAEKRKSSTKIKATPAKKTKKEAPKPTSSKPKPEKKKKGDPATSSRNTGPVKIKKAKVDEDGSFKDVYKKEISRSSAINLLLYSTLCPFRFSRFYMCLYCTQSYLDMSELVCHTTTVHSAIGKKDLRRVLSRTGKSQPIKVNVIDYGCKLCDSVAPDFEALKNHLVETHKKEIDIANDGVMPFKITDKEYQCILCKETFVEYRFLNKHVSGHFRNFFCDQCAAGFVTAGRLRVHLKGHQIGPHPCTDCDKIFNTLAAKIEHYKRVHAKTKRNICKHCQASFMDYYQKKKHMKDVHGIKFNDFKCNFCSKIFLVSSALKAHERQVHLKNKKFTCDICNYQSHYKESIKRHVMCHTGEKNFKCDICKKAYARHSTLREHMRIHNSDRFVCNYCGRAFVQNCSLKTHIRTHHQDVEII
ncbi:gastrula zinc finger protein XlCGF26.1-like isoform X13 [Galleria mellonella]|uniref:Gastrula zinc finger protein XlCGF26.1-like isoform X13 n=1 Tax=Galleria mellonella TaxID=7137 RepID=A0ABM3N0U5_GALME|nr:gastrula zinc finger protein XlCGF26.1-like isoform X13 [Galleria mellonella]